MQSRKIVVAATLSALLLASCGKETETPKKYRSFAVSETGTVVLSEGTVVPVTGENVAELGFETAGRIESVEVRIGDRVEKGQLLAKIGNREAEILADGYGRGSAYLEDVRQAADAVKESAELLAESRSLVAEADRKAAETGKRLAERDLELAKKNLENSRLVFSGSALSASERVTQAERNLALAETQLSGTEELFSEQESGLRSSSLAALSSAFVGARGGRDFMDAFLGITEENRHKNDAFENYLGAKDSSSLSRGDTAFRAFDAKYRETYDWYYANVVGKTDVPLKTVKEALERASATLALEREALHAVKGILEKTVASASFGDADIAAAEQKTDAFLANLEAGVLSPGGGGVEGSRSAIAAFEKDRGLKTASLKESVEIARSALDLAKSGKTTVSGGEKRDLDALEIAVGVKEDAVRVAESAYRKAVAAEELAKRESEAGISEARAKSGEIRAKKAEAETGRELSLERMGYSEIRAPFSGVVTERYLDPGAVVSPGTPVLQISGEKSPKASFSFDSGKTRLEAGDEISLESVKTGKSFTGKILSVGNSDSIANGKRRAEVSVSGESAQIGDRVRIRVALASVRGVTVPESAIVTRYLTPSVFAVENGRAVSKTVRVVARGEGKAVVEGLSAGVRVITEGKDLVLEGEPVE